MVKKRIVLLRHGERIDRYTESLGKNWLETAKRTQDPHLSLVSVFLSPRVFCLIAQASIHSTSSQLILILALPCKSTVFYTRTDLTIHLLNITIPG